MQANIFDIQRYSIHDGPGIRTTVFFQGCPLRCDWCCNPESQFARVQLGYHVRRCIGCGSCVMACHFHMILKDEKGVHFNRAHCDDCSGRPCVKACPAKALVTYGYNVTMDKLLLDVDRDAPFYKNSGGGITASGGEPLMQSDFLAGFFAACKKRGYHTAIETSSHVRWEAIEGILPNTDLFLCDLKHIDAEHFYARTGGHLSLVLDNLKRLRNNTDQIIIRIPLIPGFNDDTDTLRNMCRFIGRLEIRHVNLLPYHRLGKEKYESLGRPYSLDHITLQNREKLAALEKVPEEFGLVTKIGG